MNLKKKIRLKLSRWANREELEFQPRGLDLEGEPENANETIRTQKRKHTTNPTH